VHGQEPLKSTRPPADSRQPLQWPRIVEARRESINAAEAAGQARHNAKRADVPFVFLANGKEILFWDWQREAHPRPVRTFFSQSDLERRAATRQIRVDPLSVEIDKSIAGNDCSRSAVRRSAAFR